MDQTIKITNDRLNVFVAAGKIYCNTTPKSKLWYAVDKITKIAAKKLKKVEVLREEKRREFAKKKDKGVYDLTDKGAWQFDDEGYKKLVDALAEIDEQQTELPVHIVTEYDEKELSFDMRDHFEGIVIPAIDYDTFDIDNFVPPKKEVTDKA